MAQRLGIRAGAFKHSRLTDGQLRKIAGTFRGDDPGTGQLVLDFGIYDFSLIPIETLSVIYEQFLHAPDTQGTSTGKQRSAFYTPIPLVNFMLEELDSLHPFQKGMKVLDPSCGSGAFLVQCYRRIIEQDEEFVPGEPMRPAHLRDLLQVHIFGIDRDGDACRVAELSLSLTLLDYVDPPDLESTRSSNCQTSTARTSLKVTSSLKRPNGVGYSASRSSIGLSAIRRGLS